MVHCLSNKRTMNAVSEMSGLHTIRKPQQNLDETKVWPKKFLVRETTKTMLHTIYSRKKSL